jgi:hypothetical protein
MKEFEDQLRAALRPVDPPAGFSERVAGRMSASARSGSVRAPRPLPWAAIAAGLALIFGGLEYRHYQRGVEARENLIQALQITASAVEFTQQSLRTYHQETP